MRPGESYRVPEGKGMILSAGKYNGVEVYVNGRLTPVIQPNKKMNIAMIKSMAKIQLLHE